MLWDVFWHQVLCRCWQISTQRVSKNLHGTWPLKREQAVLKDLCTKWWRSPLTLSTYLNHQEPKSCHNSQQHRDIFGHINNIAFRPQSEVVKVQVPLYELYATTEWQSLAAVFPFILVRDSSGIWFIKVYWSHTPHFQIFSYSSSISIFIALIHVLLLTCPD